VPPQSPPPDAASASDRLRLDRWLWAARFFKTRSQAAAAITNGKVEVNGERAKRSRPVRLGDELRVRKGPYVLHVIVRGLPERRGPAAEAALCYEETEAGRRARETLAAELRAAPPRPHGRPTKRDRRVLARLSGR
jgi:ribosome-associated heat shock protein Hsp15